MSSWRRAYQCLVLYYYILMRCLKAIIDLWLGEFLSGAGPLRCDG